MKAVILAAGRGARLSPLTDETPKSLVFVGRQVLLEHILQALEDHVSEILIVTGHQNEKVKTYVDERENKVKTVCVPQGEIRGTWGALLSVKDFLDEPFLVVNGDDFITSEEIKKMITGTPSCGVCEATMPGYEAMVVVDGILKGWEKRPDDTALSATGMYTLTPEVFAFEPVYMNDSEAGLPHTLFAHPEYELQAVPIHSWKKVNTHEDLKELRKHLSDDKAK